MHKSRLTGFVIDCKAEDVQKAAEFWSGALGLKLKPAAADAPTYRELETKPEEMQIMVQTVDHESRVHLDLETDDLDAEVARLEKLGAKRVAFVKRWWVMEAPTGQKFCVCRPQRGQLEKTGNEW